MGAEGAAAEREGRPAASPGNAALCCSGQGKGEGPNRMMVVCG